MSSGNNGENWTELHLPAEDGHQKRPAAKLLRNWTLVLSARNIPYRTDHHKNPTRIEVPTEHLAIAQHEIDLYQKENRKEAELTPAGINLNNNILITLSVLFLLGNFHNLTYLHLSGFGHNPIDWLRLGSADSSKIIDGEWWRAITALTLHADGQHLLGNILIGGYFIVRLCQIAGSGLGWLLILSSGAFGNLLNALAHGVGHDAVGASTAIFGAIGIAGALNSTLARRRTSRYWLLPLAAAGMLLAFLGAGSENSRIDIGAHLFGFMAGLILGAPSGLLLAKWGQPHRHVNIVLAGMAISMVLGCWLLALQQG